MDTVECLSSSAYPQRPLALTWQGCRLEIEAVLSEWHRPGERLFRVRTRDGQTFELTWDETRDAWQIHPI